MEPTFVDLKNELAAPWDEWLQQMLFLNRPMRHNQTCPAFSIDLD